MFYQTKSGVPVVKPAGFHVHENITDELLIEAMVYNECLIDKAFEMNEDLVLSYDVGYQVGYSLCIPCPPHSKYVYFKVREPRKYLSRMVRGALPRSTNNVTLILSFRKTSFFLVSAWAGYPARAELGDIRRFERSKDPIAEISVSAEFWMNHALIEEYPAGSELLKDVKIICGRMGLDFSRLTAEQMSEILTARLGRVVVVPLLNYEDEEAFTEFLDNEICVYDKADKDNKENGA